MALNIPILSRDGVRKAWAVAASVLTTVTLRDVFTVTGRDPATESETGTWGVEQTLQAFLWDADEQEVVTAVETGVIASRLRLAMVRGEDLPGVTEISAKAEVLEGSTTWMVHRVESIPGGAAFILHLRI